MESTAKGYQREVLKNVLEIYRWAESQLQLANDDQSRRAVSSHNGCVLLEAPTGAGKTRMAGMLAQEFSNTSAHPSNARIVWFWFTPFAGLVEQASLSLSSTFSGLRVRSLADDRVIGGTRSGDLYVTTWASVAAANRDTRRIRMNGDVSPSLDRFLDQLRSEGFRIGVVVDEAHHGFVNAPLAREFYRDVMQPDFTLLITATPDDHDVATFKKAAGIAELHRVRVSRQDAVDAGLIKEGVKSIAYLAPPEQKNLVDFPVTALTDGWRTHNTILRTLAGEGIDLVPLMLVQVANSDSAVADARARLLEIGVPDEAIASYTSLEPSDDLLTVALDETKQVLIFKVAVALGFDAPRAFTLVSLRGSKEASFGIQVVGRILRVHARLQGRTLAGTLPPVLRFGYVFLADAENQQGLKSAGEKINQIKTELSEICPYTMVVKVAGHSEVQVLQNGQSSLLPAAWAPAPESRTDAGGSTLALQPTPAHAGHQIDLLSEFLLEPSGEIAPKKPVPSTGATPMSRTDGHYAIMAGVERTHQTEMMPLSTDALVQCVSASIDFSADVLAAGRRQSVRLVRRQDEVFGDQQVQDDAIQGRLSEDEIARRAQGLLFDAEHLDPRELLDGLLTRLANEYEHHGWATGEGELEKALNLIMVSFPNLLRKAERKCAADYKEVVAAAPLPEFLDAGAGAIPSKRNVYGVMPAGLNKDERDLVDMLDSDMSDTVEWWWRNEPRKPWSIALVMSTGDRYFPDFVVKVRNRSKGKGILLIEFKGRHILNGDETLEKAVAEHRIYKRPLMVTRDEHGKFLIVVHNEWSGKNEPGQAFRVENLAGY